MSKWGAQSQPLKTLRTLCPKKGGADIPHRRTLLSAPFCLLAAPTRVGRTESVARTDCLASTGRIARTGRVARTDRAARADLELSSDIELSSHPRIVIPSDVRRSRTQSRDRVFLCTCQHCSREMDTRSLVMLSETTNPLFQASRDHTKVVILSAAKDLLFRALTPDLLYSPLDLRTGASPM